MLSMRWVTRKPPKMFTDASTSATKPNTLEIKAASSPASALYARNLFNFLAPFVDGESGAIAIDWEDELVTGTALTRGGSIVHPLLVGSVNQGGDK
jgi:NAD/NADP transhydrogenase alpha subunit